MSDPAAPGNRGSAPGQGQHGGGDPWDAPGDVPGLEEHLRAQHGLSGGELAAAWSGRGEDAHLQELRRYHQDAHDSEARRRGEYRPSAWLDYQPLTGEVPRGSGAIAAHLQEGHAYTGSDLERATRGRLYDEDAAGHAHEAEHAALSLHHHPHPAAPPRSTEAEEDHHQWLLARDYAHCREHAGEPRALARHLASQHGLPQDVLQDPDNPAGQLPAETLDEVHRYHHEEDALAFHQPGAAEMLAWMAGDHNPQPTWPPDSQEGGASCSPPAAGDPSYEDDPVFGWRLREADPAAGTPAPPEGSRRRRARASGAGARRTRRARRQ